MDKIKFRRNGDVNLHEIKKLPEGLEEVKFDGAWILARGEATGSVHLLTVERPNLKVFKDKNGNFYFDISEKGTLSHTHDHETTTIEPGIYKQIGEREVNHYADSVVRQVID